MPTKIQIKRGLSSTIASLNLAAGEPAFTTDTGDFYVGDGVDKVLINPIDKPLGLDTTKMYSKVTVNAYGQVTAQENLSYSDIPVQPYIYAFYSGSDQIVEANQFVKFNMTSSPSPVMGLGGDGYIIFNQSGVYLINYQLNSKTAAIQTALANPDKTTTHAGTTQQSNSLGVPPVSMICGSFIVSSLASEKIAIKNLGITSIVIPSGQASFSAIKIG